jgi:hypothetical protein
VQCNLADIHDNEPSNPSNSEERDNPTVEGDLHTVRPEPTTGREHDRIRLKTEEKRKSEEVRCEVFILCSVISVRGYEMLPLQYDCVTTNCSSAW